MYVHRFLSAQATLHSMAEHKEQAPFLGAQKEHFPKKAHTLHTHTGTVHNFPENVGMLLLKVN